ncbi:hypothetical protein SPSIL_044910 [Sporomusa silvacetica DSM 10669]|uniref:histidine kinase n=1 Tax=Sporomusa silvacetica DSM 10669 TaxID=1123289 RepID=A0ABZ3IRG5_9FIRM|nr:response regulator [Sporomusa silvacetica]OZC20752.1 C4-dicarboxylate transport transcriptional regulatory protein DctD [Sporomusa silvacetica DSM 10669]
MDKPINTNTPPIKLLLIEDDSFMREMIALTLETENYEVTGVESGTEALQKLNSCNKYGGIISDMYLPDTDGLTLFEQVHPEYPDLLFLILTSETDEIIVRKAANLGITYILKDENFAETVLTALANLPQIETAPASLAQMPAKLFHDLNQPLNSIKMIAGGILFLLKQGEKLPDEELSDCMEKISVQTDLLASMLKKMRM